MDADALPQDLVNAVIQGNINLDDPATTIALLKLDAVVGVKGVFGSSGKLTAVGIQCSLCHSTVDQSFSTKAIPAGNIGHRLDGWPNRDLNVGAIIAFAPTVKPMADLLETDETTVRTVLRSWGPGKFDAELLFDGKAMRPDGKPAATLLPAAFGLAGTSQHTYTGWGGVSHWNALVANLEMQGSGTFWDPRLNDPVKFPIAARNGFWNKRSSSDMVTSKLAALQAYQLAIPAPHADGIRSMGGCGTASCCSTGRLGARVVMCRRSTQSLAGICIRRRRSGSTVFRRIGLLMDVTGRRHWAA